MLRQTKCPDCGAPWEKPTGCPKCKVRAPKAAKNSVTALKGQCEGCGVATPFNGACGACWEQTLISVAAYNLTTFEVNYPCAHCGATIDIASGTCPCQTPMDTCNTCKKPVSLRTAVKTYGSRVVCPPCSKTT